MNPSSVRLMTPDRSATTPPAAAKRYGIAMRIVCAMKTRTIIATSARSSMTEPPRARAHALRTSRCLRALAAAEEQPPHFGHRRRHRDDHDALQHIDHLLRDDGVDREPALRERREEQCRDHHAVWIVAPDQRDGDPEEAGARGESFLVVVLVAEHEVDPAESRERARERHRTNPDATHVNATVLGRLRLES